MPGLIPNQQPPGNMAPPRAAAPGAAPPPANAEDQAAYEAFVKNGMVLIDNKPGIPALVKSLDGHGNPVQGLANTLSMIVARVIASAKQAGQSLAPNVVLHGAGELLEQLADFSKRSGGHAYTDEEQALLARTLVAAVAKGQSAPSAPPGQDEQEPPGQPEEQPEEAGAPPEATPPPMGAQPPPRPMRGLMA